MPRYNLIIDFGVKSQGFKPMVRHLFLDVEVKVFELVETP